MVAIEKKYRVPFALVSILFLLWGLANNMTDTLLAAFKRITNMSDTQTSLIQFAFYGAYFCFAVPAAMFIRRYSYKAGILLGLALYACGAMLFWPAAQVASYGFYLFAIYVMAGGCSVLETTANPYIMSMGNPETATRRLNIAQSLNPMGSIVGILLSQTFILQDITHRSISMTYFGLGLVLVLIMVFMLFANMPNAQDSKLDNPMDSIRRLFHRRRYRYGVMAQFFYVGAQIGVWSFTIRLVMNELHETEARAATVYLASIICHCVARFFFTWLMTYYRPTQLLKWAGAATLVCSLVVATCSALPHLAVAALVTISFFMSLMFPTIYGTALDGVHEDAKIGASGLIMSILGGAIITPIQGMLSDYAGVNVSYLVPATCFLVVFIYAYSVEKILSKRQKAQQ